MKIATWNVNSIRVRLDRLILWLHAEQPDAVCLQELKVAEEDFPADHIREAGYFISMNCQRTYNGVAILSKTEPQDVRSGFADGVEDIEARLVSAAVNGVRIISAYIPNGHTVSSDKYAHKIEWLSRLKTYLKKMDTASEKIVICGDFNMAPADIDLARPEAWEGTVLYNEELRREFALIQEAGWVDVFRKHNPGPGYYSWWDYQRLSFPKNDGVRIDHILATRPMAELSSGAGIDRNARKGVKPSDHAPVWATFDVNRSAGGSA